MRPRFLTWGLGCLVAAAGLAGVGASTAKAQLFVSTPGLTVGVGAPVGVVPGYGVYPAYPPIVAPYAYAPVVGAYAVRPYPYVVGRPLLVAPRPFYGHRYGYRRW